MQPARRATTGVVSTAFVWGRARQGRAARQPPGAAPKPLARQPPPQNPALALVPGAVLGAGRYPHSPASQRAPTDSLRACAHKPGTQGPS
jgi:hypothetical protein